MATMTLTIGASTKSWTMSAADQTRVLEAYKKIYQNTALTNAQVFDKIAADFVRDMKSRVRAAEVKVLEDTTAEIALT